MAALQVLLAAEQSKAAIAVSSALEPEQAAAFTVRAEAIIEETAVLQAQAAAIEAEMGDIRALLAALGFSALEIDMIVSPAVTDAIPFDEKELLKKLGPIKGQEAIDLFKRMNVLEGDLGSTKEKINENIGKIKDLAVDLEALNVEGVPNTETIDAIGKAAREELKASPFEPVTVV